MDTPFYPDHYDIIEGCKVYTFYVEPTFKVKKKSPVTPKKVLGYALYPFAAVIDATENVICRTAARAILSARRRSAEKRSSREFSF